MSCCVENNNFLNRTNLQIERLKRVKSLIALACLRIKMGRHPKVSEVGDFCQYRGSIKLISVEQILKSIDMFCTNFLGTAGDGPVPAVVGVIPREAGSTCRIGRARKRLRVRTAVTEGSSK